MKKNSQKHGKLSRRKFINVTAAGSAALAGGGEIKEVNLLEE